ncbi:glycoside hydrolase family 97 catalytic domain-containing protein [Porticoccus sp. GXU_MW_L64]
MQTKLIATLLCLLALPSAVLAGTSAPNKTTDIVTLSSPDKRNVLTAQVSDGVAWFSVRRDDKPLLLKSRLGLELADAPFTAFALHKVSHSQQDNTRKQLWGQHARVRNHFNGARMVLRETGSEQPRKLMVEFRAYNDGIALRYRLPPQDHINSSRVIGEQTVFSFADDYQVSSYRPEETPATAKSIARVNRIRPPVVLSSKGGERLAIHEAGLLDSAQLQVQGDSSLPNGLRLTSTDNQFKLPYQSAWRVLMIENKPGDLLVSNLLTNLSPPSRIADTSWIKPGKALWDWRVRGERYGDFTYSIDNPSLRRYIDFAADNNVQHVMIDANWYGPEHEATTNPFTPAKGLRIKELIDYANKKGVGFILYMNDKADLHFDLDKLFQAYSQWGAAGIKYGFMKVKGQEKVRKTLRIVELAAKHKLLVNFHDGPIAPTGLRRTWPNWLTREFVHGQGDSRRSFTPSGFLEMVHLNMIAGPLDMSNGFFKLAGLEENRNYVFEPVHSTVAAETARVLIVFSGLVILPDAPEEYLKKPDLYEFIRQMPASWDESRVLHSDPQSRITMARRSGNNWFVGTAGNEQGGDIDITLDFLEPGASYRVTLYEDAADTHFKTNPEAYRIREKTVARGDIIRANIAPGGGHAMTLKKLP